MNRDIFWFSFVWDPDKELQNIEKHGVSFKEAALVFVDKDRLILSDEKHSQDEDRFFCVGFTPFGVLTVRFVYRGQKIRIIGAGHWRKGKNIYEKNKRK